MGKQVDLLQGTLEILILKAISLGPLHGYGMLLRIQQISGERLEIPQGSFYIALYRIEHKGMDKRRVGGIGKQPAREVLPAYASGSRQLKTEMEKWSQMTEVVNTVLCATPEQI